MLGMRHPIDFTYTTLEPEALLRCARAHGLQQGGDYDVRSAAINVWGPHWLTDARQAEFDVIGTFCVRRGDTPALWLIETDEGFSLEDLMAGLSRLALQAWGHVKQGDVPTGGGA
jgi:hypothetical protein